MRFVIEQLFRVTATGCNVCVHIQQLLAYKVQHTFMGRRDFRGAVISMFADADRFELWLQDIGKAIGCGHIDEQLPRCVEQRLAGTEGGAT